MYSENLFTVTRRNFIRICLLSTFGLSIKFNKLLAFFGINSSKRPSFVEQFANPPLNVQPKFRWWWPHGLVDPSEIRKELEEMAEVGFGGAEISDVHHSISEDLNSKEYGWGTRPWLNSLEAALETAKKHTMTIDLTIGPSWPAALPSITPNSIAAAKELATGHSIYSER